MPLTENELRDLLHQRRDRVLDPDAVQDLALTIHPHDHTAATMQIDPDVTSIHRGLPSSEEELVCGSPESPTGTRNLHEERRPRPFIASSGQGEAAATTVVAAAASLTG